MSSFSGFTPENFDAFAQEKWASHAYNRERLEVKLSLTSLGKACEPDILQTLPDLEMGLTEERPSIFNQHKVRAQSVYFLRNEVARQEIGVILDKGASIAQHVSDPALHHRHINLAVRIGLGGLEAGLWLHPNARIDWKNVVERCSSHWERDNLNDELKTLPETVVYRQERDQFAAGKAVREVDCEELLHGFSAGSAPIFFGEIIDRGDPVLASPDLVGRLSALFAGLLDLYSFISWRRDNDFHAIKDVLKEQKEQAQRQFRDVKPGDEVRVLKGLAVGRLGVVEELERKGVVKVRLGTIVISLKAEELGEP